MIYSRNNFPGKRYFSPQILIFLSFFFNNKDDDISSPSDTVQGNLYHWSCSLIFKKIDGVKVWYASGNEMTQASSKHLKILEKSILKCMQVIVYYYMC